MLHPADAGGRKGLRAGYHRGEHFIEAHTERTALATPNYSYEKRQRELAKKRKKEEKLKKRAEPRGDAPAEDSNDTAAQPGPGSDTAPPGSDSTPPAAP